MSTVRYTVLNGEVVAEKRNNARRLYTPDPLGSTVALLDNTQTKTDTFSYWPYGEQSARTGTTPTPFMYVGSAGYYNDNASLQFVRTRTLSTSKGSWLQPDPAGIVASGANLNSYVPNNPVSLRDPSGLQGPWPYPDPGGNWQVYCRPDPCAPCALAILSEWWDMDQHWCNHAYTHCMLCCVLTRVRDANCATTWQEIQNQNPLYYSKSDMLRYRMDYCKKGISLAGEVSKGQSCDSLCRTAYPWKDHPKDKRCSPDMNKNRKPLPVPAACSNSMKGKQGVHVLGH